MILVVAVTQWTAVWRDRTLVPAEDHFGEDATLEDGDDQIVLSFLIDHSAETSTMEPAYKIRNSLKPSEAPIAISETPYYIKKHKNIPPEAYERPDILAKSNCMACHEDAEYGTFEDHLIKFDFSDDD